MKSRLLWFVLVLLILMFIYSVIEPFIAEKKGNAPVTTPPAQTEIYRLSLGHDHKTSSPHHQAALRFAELIKTKSNGRVEVEVFPDQQLGTGHQMVEQVREGTLPIALLPAARLTGIAPAMQYIDLPFLFPKREDAYELLEGDVGKMLFDQLEPLGIIGCAFWDSGFKQLTANIPIRKPADYNGLKVRVMKSPIIRDQFESYGAQVVPIDFHQLHQALKDGVVDAQENPLIGISVMKLYEVQSHLTISNHAYLSYILMCSKKVMDSLPLDIQELLVNTAKEVTKFERELLLKEEAGYLETIKNAGVEIHHLTASESRDFQEATKHIRDKYRQKIGEDILDRTETLLTLKYGAGGDVVIGLDADLSLKTALIGKSLQKGAQLAIKELNEAGGVLGRKIRMVSFDHGGISARGIANINQFATVPGLIAVVGGVQSWVAVDELEAIHNNKIIYVSPWASAMKIVENGYQPNYVFRLAPPSNLISEYLIKKALKKGNQIALLLDNNIWGKSNHKVMIKSLAQHGLSPVAVEWINAGEDDVSNQLEKIVDSGAQVIIMAVNPGDSISAVRGLIDHSITLPVFSHWSVGRSFLWQEFGQELQKIDLRFIQSFAFYNSQNQQAQHLTQNYLLEYRVDKPQNIPEPSAIAHAYDIVHLLAMAVQKSGSFKRPDIRDSLEKLQFYQGVVDDYEPPFSPDRHDAITKENFFVARFDQQGKIIPISN